MSSVAAGSSSTDMRDVYMTVYKCVADVRSSQNRAAVADRHVSGRTRTGSIRPDDFCARTPNTPP
ncbi:hypothetical protein [Halorubrum ezzemoulense]|uniref:Uncharacterized protein n=1 Tax=Halorubrum ezzemoulense TaxID=337243 RepID=A0A256JUD0_HALEZ|nr:hypothetical protein [Halorubrum ezzemoulense]OYR72391.1 hypothetical protein DJ78_03280 [Halorubrum ezzemoulense]